MPARHWDESRCEELERLERLLNDVACINSGSHCLERIARCIKEAEALKAYDFDSGRASFVRFLCERALAEEA